MTRSVHPCSSSSKKGASPVSASATKHPYETLIAGRQQAVATATVNNAGLQSSMPAVVSGQQQLLVPLVTAPSLPITVTTASHADPPGTTVLSSHQLNLQVATGLAVPTKQLHLPPAKTVTYVPPSTVAGPKGGFTLPVQPLTTTTNKNVVADPVVPDEPDAEAETAAAANAGMKKSAASVPLLRGYSAASVASIHAQDDRTPNALGRHSYSAPNTVVLAHNKSKFKYLKVVGGRIPKSKSLSLVTDLSPQAFLDKMISGRGYSTSNFCSLDGGYYCKPTALQQASYGMKVVQAVRTSDAELLQNILDCGLSPNPCNQFGESVVHMVCRRGDVKLLQVLVDAGCSLQVTDDFGRTPLHDACWTAEPSFDCVELILNYDPRLLRIVDCRGSSPLSYVKREHWKPWIEFLQSKADRYWAPRDVSKLGEETPPLLASEAAHSRPVPDPKHAIPVELATLVSSGKLDPIEFLRRRKEAMNNGKQVASGQRETATVTAN